MGLRKTNGIVVRGHARRGTKGVRRHGRRAPVDPKRRGWEFVEAHKDKRSAYGGKRYLEARGYSVMIRKHDYGSLGGIHYQIWTRMPRGWTIAHGRSLPYFRDDSVGLFTDEFGRVEVDKEDFVDKTSEGGRAYQFYTWKIRNWERKR